MKKIKSIKKGFISRNLGMAKMAFGAGKDLLSNRKDAQLIQNVLNTLEKRSDTIGHELSLMKGSIMKAGQALSVFLGDFLPESVIKTFAALEAQSYFLEWEAIKKQIPASFLKELEFEQEPLAAASIGQVHLAVEKQSSDKYAVKIQYPGVRKAVGRDVLAIKWVVSSLKVVPKTLDLTPIYQEIKEMLYQEMDYTQELEHIKAFQERCKNLDRIKVIEPIEKFCTETILTTRYEKGTPLRDLDVASIPQEERNKLGEVFLDLFYRELYQWGAVQTDAHFGNYLIETNPQTGHSCWILLDFGATKTMSGKFLTDYQNTIKGVAKGDRELFFQSFRNIAQITNFEKINHDLLWEYLEIMGSPFQGGVYDWGKSDIPEKAMSYLPRLLRIIPEGRAAKDAVFLDRKIASVFYVLKKLECSFDAKAVAQRYL